MARSIIDQHPEEVRADLNPNYHAGENYGPAQGERRTADTIKDVYDLLPDFTDDELRGLPVLATGTRLEQGAVYFDLQHPEWGEVKARGDMEAQADNWWIPKSEVDYLLRNRLLAARRPGSDACE